jgi:hypothetical protein
MKPKMAQDGTCCVWRHRNWTGHVPEPTTVPVFQSNGPEAVRAAFLLLTLPHEFVLVVMIR